MLREAFHRLKDIALSNASVTNMSGAASMEPSKESMLAFRELVAGLTCSPGAAESIEVLGSDGSRMIWSCNRSEY